MEASILAVVAQWVVIFIVAAALLQVSQLLWFRGVIVRKQLKRLVQISFLKI